MKKLVTICAVVTMILAVSGVAQGAIITVTPDGADNFDKIRTAINGAASGDTIHVLPGTYTDIHHGQPAYIDTSNVTIMGWDDGAGAVAGAGVVNIDVANFYGSGSGNNTGFAINANNATISGFTVTFNNTAAGVGIALNGGASAGSGATISGNFVSGFAYGIQHEGSNYYPGSGNLISGNMLYGNQYGIRLYGAGVDGTVIADNTAYENLIGIGMYRDFTGDIKNVTVQGNTLYDNDYYSIYAKDNQPGPSGSFQNINITGNDISVVSNDRGILLSSTLTDASPFAVNYNNIYGTTTNYLVQSSAAAGTLDAKCNWWGVAPPDTSRISGNLDVSTWLDGPYPGGNCVPEPATLCVLLIGALLALFGRRRRA